LVKKLNICVLYCLEYGLVASTRYPNLCVGFDVAAEIVNYNISLPIDTNTFDYLVAEITNISTKDYTGRWRFSPEETIRANPGKTLNFEEGQVPFLPNDDENLERFENLNGNLKRYNVSLNHSFFELDRKYVFYLDITSYNILNNSLRSTEELNFTLIMNSYPKEGGIEIIPSVGLHNTTNFVLRCQNWTDDTCDSSELTYYFYAKENLSSEIKVLKEDKINTKKNEENNLNIKNEIEQCKKQINEIYNINNNNITMIKNEIHDTIKMYIKEEFNKIKEENQNKFIKIDLSKIGKNLEKYKSKIDIDKNTYKYKF
jgi:hypothetical protein